MGANTSKSTGQAAEHVFTGSAPVRFSQEIIDSLQASPETDSTRSKTLESHIQSRVHRTLLELQDRESTALKHLQETLSAPDESSNNKALAVSSETVQKDIEHLRAKLAARKKIVDEDPGVQKAKTEVVKCLRENDRRPLDCWREVQQFREEVARLEREWVGKITG